MLCPHCKHEHPENIRYCPVTGKEIFLLKVCLNCDKIYVQTDAK
jgi:hypothetical protein